MLRVVALQRQLTTKMSSLEQVLAQAEKLKGLEGDELAKLTDSLMDQLKTLKVEPAEKVFNRVLKHKAFGQFSRELQHRLLIFSWINFRWKFSQFSYKPKVVCTPRVSGRRTVSYKIFSRPSQRRSQRRRKKAEKFRSKIQRAHAIMARLRWPFERTFSTR